MVVVNGGGSGCVVGGEGVYQKERTWSKVDRKNVQESGPVQSWCGVFVGTVCWLFVLAK